ncbi:MAG: phosphoglycerate dehydrogenase [Burkholderiales bacterium]|nr:phosphoglycerate dehydrogenase [Burkholderiales bacterium]MDE1928519.1 phosphoglycerate dehydrogenase [Burkholderiales bacterium]MDE2159407.1 phosphoglycerate dehydrogenase [Burkholderiales bacterium]
MAESLRVLVLNRISAAGLARLPAERYRVGTDLADPDAILLRSADLHGAPIAASVRAVARAGAGTNNIPVAALSARGVPVFNAPGANANAVKELVLAAMLIASRHLAPALGFVDALDVAAPDLESRVEDGKKAYAGRELLGRTLGIVGLGRIGCLVAEAAIALGMKVLGYDPEITVDAAWSLPSSVRRAASVDEVLRGADFVTLHVPLLPATRDLVGAANMARMRPDAVLLNFSREGVVSNAAVLQALDARALGGYVCDFPSPELHRRRGVVTLPHLGASTAEAEENCALMVVDQLRAYLEDGEVVNAVNFPAVQMPRGTAFRVAIANSNVPNMLGQISTTMARAGLNIHNMLNKSRGEMAYTLVDVDSAVGAGVLDALAAIPGVLAVRYLPAR